MVCRKQEITSHVTFLLLNTKENSDSHEEVGIRQKPEATDTMTWRLDMYVFVFIVVRYGGVHLKSEHISFSHYLSLTSNEETRDWLNGVTANTRYIIE